MKLQAQLWNYSTKTQNIIVQNNGFGAVTLKERQAEPTQCVIQLLATSTRPKLTISLFCDTASHVLQVPLLLLAEKVL